MKARAIYILVLLVFNLILLSTSASKMYYYSIPHHHEALAPEIILKAGINGTVYIISTDETWVEVNITGSLTETYYEYVLNITNLSSNTNYQIKLENASITGISRLTNFTVYFHDGTTLKQIEIFNGDVTQSSGLWYSVATSATIYLSIAIGVNAPGSSTVDLRLYIVQSGTTSPEIIQTVRINVN